MTIFLLFAKKTTGLIATTTMPTIPITMPEIKKLVVTASDTSTRHIPTPSTKAPKTPSTIAKISLALNLRSFDANETYDALFKYVLKPIYIKSRVTDQTIMQYMSKYFLTGVTAIVSEWLERDCKDDIMFLCEIIILCAHPKT